MASKILSVRIPIRDLSTLIKFYSEENKILISSQSSIIKDAISDFIDILESNGRVQRPENDDIALRYLSEAGLTKGGHVSRRKLGKSLTNIASRKSLPEDLAALSNIIGKELEE
jgi:chaperonin GroEL (HSP60 family)